MFCGVEKDRIGGGGVRNRTGDPKQHSKYQSEDGIRFIIAAEMLKS